jgi:hypothetical protein
MGKVDHREDAVYHGVPEGDKRIDAAQLKGVQPLLQYVNQTPPSVTVLKQNREDGLMD